MTIDDGIMEAAIINDIRMTVDDTPEMMIGATEMLIEATERLIEATERLTEVTEGLIEATETRKW